MVLRKVLTPKPAKLCVTAPSSRDIGIAPADLDVNDETDQFDITTANNNLSTRSEPGETGLGLADNFVVELAIVVMCAIVFRRLWILHGIHFIVLRRTLRLAIAWIDYFFDAGIYEEVKRTALHIFRISMKETEKALSGDSIRLFFAASSLQNYTSWGHHIVFAILRRQYKHVNKLELNEQEKRQQATEMLVEKRRRQQRHQQP